MAGGKGRPGDFDWNWTFVKIETDEGIYGVGEGSLQYKDQGLRAELESFREFLVGKDPFQIELLWNSIYRGVTWTGGPVTTSALSAIDLALWDIKGKALGVPVYELLGGKVNDSIKLYANGWSQSDGSPEENAADAKAVVEAGYQALKLYPFCGPQVATPERIQMGLDRVQAVREAVGPDVEVAIDIRGYLNVGSARRVARRLEPFNIAWMEEPIRWDNPKTLVEFARSVSVPIATGEQLYTRWGLREILESNAVSVIQPDICHAGGMSELRKIASMAEVYYVSVSPHNSNGPISTVASLQLQTTIPNANMQELFLNMIELYNEVLTVPLVVKNGHCSPPAGPGWGTDIDEEALGKYPPTKHIPVESEPYPPF